MYLRNDIRGDDEKMTDYICEQDNGGILTEYVDDGKNEVVLVSRKASVYRKKYRVPHEAKEAMRLLEGLKKG